MFLQSKLTTLTSCLKKKRVENFGVPTYCSKENIYFLFILIDMIEFQSMAFVPW